MWTSPAVNSATDRAAEDRRHVAAARDLRIEEISSRSAMWITAAQALTAPDQTAAHDLLCACLLDGDTAGNPDLVLDTAGANIDDLVVQVIAVLNERSPRNNR
jgi:hypothetical protein